MLFICFSEYIICNKQWTYFKKQCTTIKNSPIGQLDAASGTVDNDEKGPVGQLDVASGIVNNYVELIVKLLP